MRGLNDFHHCMQVGTRPAIYRPFFTEKTPENAQHIFCFLLSHIQNGQHIQNVLQNFEDYSYFQKNSHFKKSTDLKNVCV